ncbi:DUF465 domain-containing protein [Thiotrichales bacterium 19S11-10]|nr:DUF465 domain-containing protein [Thiotrichales bacterium 19S11-10]
MLEHHPLIKEFPEYTDQIHQLKESDRHFIKLFDQYEKVDKEVFRVEANQEGISEIHLEDLKKERLLLKDEIYQIILKNKFDS